MDFIEIVCWLVGGTIVVCLGLFVYALCSVAKTAEDELSEFECARQELGSGASAFSAPLPHAQPSKPIGSAGLTTPATLGLPVLAASIVGACFGISGALLLAMPAFPGWGFAAFIVSNVAWLFTSSKTRQWWQHAQHWAFLVCSGIGLWNWWLGPLVLG